MSGLNNPFHRLLHHYAASSSNYTCHQFAMAQALDTFHPVMVRQILRSYELKRDTSDFFVRVLNGIISEAYKNRKYYPDILDLQGSSISNEVFGVESLLEKENYFILFQLDEDSVQINHSEFYSYDPRNSFLYYLKQHEGRLNLWKKGEFEKFFSADPFELHDDNLLISMLRRKNAGYPERRVPVLTKNSVGSVTPEKLEKIIGLSIDRSMRQ